MSRQPSLFGSTPSSVVGPLSPELNDMQQRLLAALKYSREPADLRTVFEKIFVEQKFIQLVDFADYCRSNPTNLNRILYRIIISDTLEDFWIDQVLNASAENKDEIPKQNPKGLFQFNAAVISKGFIFVDVPEADLYSTKSEYLFNQLAGTYRASQAKAAESTERVVTLCLNSLDDYEKALCHLYPPYDHTAQTTFKINLHDLKDNQSHYRLMLLYAFLELKAVLKAAKQNQQALMEIESAKKLGESIARSRIHYLHPTDSLSSPFSTVLALRQQALISLGQLGIPGSNTYKYFFLLSAALLDISGDYEALIEYIKNYRIGDHDCCSPQISCLLMSFRFYQESNQELGNHYFDFAIQEGGLNFHQLKSLEHSLELLQLNSQNAKAAFDVTTTALAHLVNRYNQFSQGKTPPLHYNQLGAVLLIYYLHQKRAQACKELLKRIFSDPDEQLKLSYNQGYSEEAAQGWLEIANSIATTEKEKELISKFKTLSETGTNAPSEKPSDFELYRYYYIAQFYINENNFKKATNYLVKQQNLLPQNSSIQLVCQLSIILTYLKMLDSTTNDAKYINSLPKSKEYKKRTYLHIIEKLKKIYESRKLHEGYGIARLIHHIYTEKAELLADSAAEKLTIETESKAWFKAAERDRSAAEAQLTEHQITELRVADPKAGCPLSTVINLMLKNTSRFYSHFIFQEANCSFESQLHCLHSDSAETDYCKSDKSKSTLSFQLQLGNLQDDLEKATHSYLDKGIAIGNFYCIDLKAKKLLKQLKITDPEAGNFASLTNELTKLGELAYKHHGAIGCLLLAEIHMQIAEHTYDCYLAHRTSGDESPSRLFTTEPSTPNKATSCYARAIEHRGLAYCFFKDAEDLHRSEDGSKLNNALFGKEFYDFLCKPANQGTDRKERLQRFAQSKIPLVLGNTTRSPSSSLPRRDEPPPDATNRLKS